MKINDLTEDSLKTLKETSYAVFKNNKLEDITLFKLNDWDRPFNDLYEEYGGSTLKSFKEQYKDCEMFELSLINKPVETTNEQLNNDEKIFILNCLEYCNNRDTFEDAYLDKWNSIKNKLKV